MKNPLETIAEKAWIGCYIDTDGCITTSHGWPRVWFNNTDRKLLKEVNRILVSNGVISAPKTILERQSSNKPYYGIQIVNREAEQLLKWVGKLVSKEERRQEILEIYR